MQECGAQRVAGGPGVSGGFGTGTGLGGESLGRGRAQRKLWACEEDAGWSWFWWLSGGGATCLARVLFALPHVSPAEPIVCVRE